MGISNIRQPELTGLECISGTAILSQDSNLNTADNMKIIIYEIMGILPNQCKFLNFTQHLPILKAILLFSILILQIKIINVS
jgi:hypothetical protein